MSDIATFVAGTATSVLAALIFYFFQKSFEKKKLLLELEVHEVAKIEIHRRPDEEFSNIAKEFGIVGQFTTGPDSEVFRDSGKEIETTEIICKIYKGKNIGSIDIDPLQIEILSATEEHRIFYFDFKSDNISPRSIEKSRMPSERVLVNTPVIHPKEEFFLIILGRSELENSRESAQLFVRQKGLRVKRVNKKIGKKHKLEIHIDEDNEKNYYCDDPESMPDIIHFAVDKVEKFLDT